MILAIDIGKYKICAGVGYVNDTGVVVIEHSVIRASKGFENGMVTNKTDAMESLSAVLQDIRKQSPERITQAWVCISGLQVHSMWKSAKIDIEGACVSQHDINKVISKCMEGVDLETQDYVHVQPYLYTVDTVITKTPVKMEGRTLKADTLLCVGNKTVIDNIHSIFDDCGMRPPKLAVDGYMSALSCLTAPEMELEYSMCMDIGDSTTSVSLFYQGDLVWCKNFAFGAGEIPHRIVQETSMYKKTAQEYCKRATAWTRDVGEFDKQHMLTYERTGEENSQYNIKLHSISMLTEKHYTTIFKMVKDTIPAQFGHIKHIVLSGGGAQTNDIQKLASHVMQANVRIGKPTVELSVPKQSINISPALVGLIKYSKMHISVQSQNYMRTHGMEYTGGLWSRIWQWIKDNK